jgi:hypothetical protein
MTRKTTPREDRLLTRCVSSYSKSIELCGSSICKATHKTTTTVITSSPGSWPTPCNLNGAAYHDHMLRVHDVPHIDNDPLDDRMIFMDDNSKPLRACVVREFRQQEANDIFHWPTMSFYMNPIEHARTLLAAKWINVIHKIHNVKIYLY